MNYFVTGIDTDSGKTLVSAILCEALRAEYWKPVQAGAPTDSATIHSWLPDTVIHPEQYLLHTPASPHAAAKIDGVSIHLTDFKLPKTKNDLIIEGAGGCLVPLNDKDFVIDLANLFNATIVLAADLYLGSINHTLLTLNELKRRKLNVKGLIFNGDSNAESEHVILQHAALPCLLRIQREREITSQLIKKYAAQLLTNWHE